MNITKRNLITIIFGALLAALPTILLWIHIPKLPLVYYIFKYITHPLGLPGLAADWLYFFVVGIVIGLIDGSKKFIHILMISLLAGLIFILITEVPFFGVSSFGWMTVIPIYITFIIFGGLGYYLAKIIKK